MRKATSTRKSRADQSTQASTPTIRAKTLTASADMRRVLVTDTQVPIIDRSPSPSAGPSNSSSLDFSTLEAPTEVYDDSPFVEDPIDSDPDEELVTVQEGELGEQRPDGGDVPEQAFSPSVSMDSL